MVLTYAVQRSYAARRPPAQCRVITPFNEKSASRAIDVHQGDVLTKIDSEAVLRGIADTLTVLAERLLEHLDYEEQNVGPTLRRMQKV